MKHKPYQHYLSVQLLLEDLMDIFAGNEQNDTEDKQTDVMADNNHNVADLDIHSSEFLRQI